AALFGMTRDTGRAELAAAALCSVAYQSRDLLTAIAQDGITVDSLRVDGGMTANRWYLQALSDLTQTEITRCHTTDATALGAAFLAALQLGYFSCLNNIEQIWQAGWQFQPQLPAITADGLYRRWQRAVVALTTLDLSV
ncbi:FGGY-family carbohydrate kinase, partial [Rheinheimera aquimaris]|nr:glycerol kinase [Rheinheimera sp.]